MDVLQTSVTPRPKPYSKPDLKVGLAGLKSQATPNGNRVGRFNANFENGIMTMALLFLT